MIQVHSFINYYWMRFIQTGLKENYVQWINPLNIIIALTKLPIRLEQYCSNLFGN